MTFIEKPDLFVYHIFMAKGGQRTGSGRKAISGKEIKLKLPFELIETVDELYSGNSLNDKVRMSISDGINAKLNNYGVVYTPDYVTDFVVSLLTKLIKNDSDFLQKEELSVLDPACGECSLLFGLKRNEFFSKKRLFLFGNDVDDHYKEIASNHSIVFYSHDAISPSRDPESFWKTKINPIDILIENPPWSTEKVYNKSKLINMGYEVAVGQYDAYSLFVDLSLRIVSKNGYCAFIIPDSVFTSEDDTLREYIFKQSDVKVIARLGEKLFPNIHRSAAVIICKKCISDNNQIMCFRLGTEDRKKVIDGKKSIFDIFENSYYLIEQNRLSKESSFSIDIKDKDVNLIQKIKSNKVSVCSYFRFGRGVEISKRPDMVICPECGHAQGYLKNDKKTCVSCGNTFDIATSKKVEVISLYSKKDYSPILVGENIQRYKIDGKRYLNDNVKGIELKKECFYNGNKILVRKTGLGIKALIINKPVLYTQTVYSLTPINKDCDVYYFLGLLSSRLMYYFHLKTSGENEWKSHPYITKQTLYSFPFVEPSKSNRELVKTISNYSKELSHKYSKRRDLELEQLVFDLYGLTKAERKAIIDEINNLPDIGVFNEMKVRSDV